MRRNQFKNNVMKKSTYLMMIFFTFVLFSFSSCSSSDDDGNGGELATTEICTKPARYLQGTYKGTVNKKEATLIFTAKDNIRTTAELTYMSKEKVNGVETFVERSIVLDFDVYTSCSVETLEVDFFEVDEGSTSGSYIASMLFYIRQQHISFFTIEDSKSYLNIYFTEGKKVK